MGQDDRTRPAFEAAAEEELDRIRGEIEATRRRRKQANEAFDSFVRSFRETPDRSRLTPPPVRTLPREPRSADALKASPPPMTPPGAAEPMDAAPVVSAAQGVPAAPAVPAALRPTPGGNRTRVRNVTVFTVLAAAAGLFVFNLGRPRVEQPPPAGSQPTQVPAPRVDTPAPQPDSPADQRLNAQLVTLRPVWVRVLVDGERTIERELPGGQKIPLAAARSIAVRAGDAGAVRLWIDGKDQGPLGPDGAVATRTFTKPR